jgi:hypothetical protein
MPEYILEIEGCACAQCAHHHFILSFQAGGKGGHKKDEEEA